MKNKTPYFLLLAVLALTIQTQGQSPQENLDKYWDYRALFFDNFIVDIDPSSLPTGLEI